MEYKFTEEFGYIPEDWDVYLLSTLGNIQMCRRILQDWTTSNGEIPFYKIGTIGQTPDAFISRTLFEEFRKKYNYPRKSEVLITCSGTIGKCIQFDGKDSYYQDSNIVWLHNNSPSYLSNNFLYYYLSNIEWNSLSSTTITRLYNDDLLNLFLLLPPFFEQEKIAEVLCNIDELIESTQKLIDKKKNLKTATMQKLLTPKPHWLKKTLGELNIKMLKGSGLLKEDLKDNGRYSCIHYGELFTYYKEHINKILHFTDEMTVPSKENDVLMPSSDVTPTGLAKASCINFKDVALGGDILIIRCENIIDGTFLSYIIRKDKKQILQLVSGTTVYHIYPNDMKRFEIFYPNSISEQKNIVSILQDMDAEIEALEKELNKYKDLKTGMMQELLTGKKRLLNNPNKVELFNVKKMSTPANKKVANDEFKDAIIISMLAYKFGSNQYPLGAFRRQKLSYLFKRHNNLPIDEYLKKAMGPYNPQMKYSGGEGIAIRNKYVKEVKQRGLIASSEIAKAKTYFDKYYSKDSLLWLEQNFRYKSNNELEVLATIDYTILDLKAQNKEITLANIKEYINNNAEWKPKLEKPFFTDSAIIKAIQESKNLLNSH